MNGTLKTISIIAAIVITTGSIIWGFANRSGNLDRVVQDVAVIEAQGAKTAEELTAVEKAVILIQNDMSYMKSDIADILVTQKVILLKLGG